VRQDSGRRESALAAVSFIDDGNPFAVRLPPHDKVGGIQAKPLTPINPLLDCGFRISIAGKREVAPSRAIARGKDMFDAGLQTEALEEKAYSAVLRKFSHDEE